MQVGNEFIEAKKEERASGKANRGGEPGQVAEIFGQFNRGRKKAPVGCGNHNASRESKHAVQPFARHFFEEEDEGCAGCGHQPRKGGRQKGEEDGVGVRELFQVFHGGCGLVKQS